MRKYISQKDLTEKSVELWAKELEQTTFRELTEDEFFMMSFVTFNEDYIQKDESKAFQSLTEEWNGVSIIVNRLKLHSFTMSNAAMLLCGSMIDSPGEAVMLLNYIQYRCSKHSIHHVDMKALSSKIIPDGFFTKETLSEFWEKQKFVSEEGRLLNMLDYPKFAESISVESLKKDNQ